MHEAGAVVGGDELVGHDPEVLARGRIGVEEVERALVAQADQVGGVDRADDLGVVAEHGCDPGGGHHHVATARAGRPGRSSIPGPTATAVFDGSVQGVVVHTRRSKSASTTGNRTYTDSSVTSR